jgi:hypothetical protein
VQVHGVAFKKRAPKAIKEIKAFAEQSMVCGFLSILRFERVRGWVLVVGMATSASPVGCVLHYSAAA